MSAAPIPPGVIAAAVAEARAFLRMTGEGEQALLERLAASAILLAEAFTGGALIARAHEDVLSAGSGWRVLAAGPVTAITGVTGLPADGASFALPVGDYAVDLDADGRGWVRVIQPGAAGRVVVAYTAGATADWAGVPVPVAQGVVTLIAHLFDDRGGMSAPPAAVAALWRPFRRMRLTLPGWRGELGR